MLLVCRVSVQLLDERVLLGVHRESLVHHELVARLEDQLLHLGTRHGVRHALAIELVDQSRDLDLQLSFVAQVMQLRHQG